MKNGVFVRRDSDSSDWELMQQATGSDLLAPAPAAPVGIGAVYIEVVISEELKTDPFTLQSVEDFLSGADTLTGGIRDDNNANDVATVDQNDQLAGLPQDIDAYFDEKTRQPGALASRKTRELQRPPTELETMLSDQERKERRRIMA